jgi:hypothetical protein
MILPHLLALADYRNSWSVKQGWKILDNGANEGITTSPAALVTLGKSVNANELVIPDVMAECDLTLARVKDFFSDPVSRDWDNGYMAVIQGKNRNEWIKCFEEYRNIGRITSLALPRLMARYADEDIRLRMAEELQSRDNNLPIHCLGATPWVREVASLASQGIVRGLDTSLPYVLAKAGIDLRFTEDYVDRGDHDEYFNGLLTINDVELCGINEEMYLLSAGIRA